MGLIVHNTGTGHYTCLDHNDDEIVEGETVSGGENGQKELEVFQRLWVLNLGKAENKAQLIYCQRVWAT